MGDVDFAAVRALWVAAIEQALEDLQRGDGPEVRDAARWLGSTDMPTRRIACEAVGLDERLLVASARRVLEARFGSDEARLLVVPRRRSRHSRPHDRAARGVGAPAGA